MPCIKPQFNFDCNPSLSGSIENYRMQTMADRVKEAMDKAGLDIARTARLCGVSYQAIKKVLDGNTQSMDGKTLLLLAKHTGFEAEWLLFGTPPKHRAYAKNEYQALTLTAMENMPPEEQYKIPEVVALLAQPKKRMSQ